MTAADTAVDGGRLPATAGSVRPCCKATGLRKSYHRGIWPVRRTQPVLRGVDIRLGAGEVVGPLRPDRRHQGRSGGPAMTTSLASVRRFLADYARNPVNLLLLVVVPTVFVVVVAGSMASEVITWRAVTARFPPAMRSSDATDHGC